MTLPSAINYPVDFDSDNNLYAVHDSLRVFLTDDYNPGDTSIQVAGDTATLNRFPPVGIITLVDQCSDPELRAISFYYKSRTTFTFNELELLSGFTDNVKYKDITNVVQNVMAEHHNSIKDAVVAIQKFAGIKGTIASIPLQGTLEERINFLRKITLVPRAWFKATSKTGLVPLTVEFEDLSFRLGTDGTTGTITRIWDFGDNTGPSITTIEATEGPVTENNVLVNDTDGGKIKKTYSKPGFYDVSLTVTNKFGTDTVTLPNFINARVQSPDIAWIYFQPKIGQIVDNGDIANDIYPTIRTRTNSLVDIYVPLSLGVNPSTGKTYAGESVVGSTPIDSITSYTWNLSDDLDHGNSSSTKASYGIGGYYDLTLRCDTQYGSYRITNYTNSVDVVENYNLWLWHYKSSDSTLSSYEFGLTSETFKNKSPNSLAIIQNSSFLNSQNNSEQQIREFKRNNGFAPRGTTSSGDSGNGVIYWATGRNPTDSPSTEKIKQIEYSGFLDVYTSTSFPEISRPWNWFSFNTTNNIHFLLGGTTTSIPSGTSPTNQVKTSINLDSTVTTVTTFTSANYRNAATELLQNMVTFNAGISEQGNMSVYRTAWHNGSGYILRNYGVGTFFRIYSFYKTSGTITNEFTEIRKISDMSGSTKVEGQLTSLQQGVFLFNNSGSVSAYNPTTTLWEVGGPGLNSLSYKPLQDISQPEYNNTNQTLLVASDNESIAYLSFDYSSKAFIKFNSNTLTFSSVSSRPSGSQWLMSIY